MALAQRIQENARVVDVGTDHARLPLWLLQRGVTENVTAVDIADNPLRNARNLAEHVGLYEQLHLVKSNGLTALCGDDYDTVVIAGMGGETIADIIAASPWSLQKHLLLQPMSRPERLLAYLESVGLLPRVTMVRDGQREYTIFEVGI